MKYCGRTLFKCTVKCLNPSQKSIIDRRLLGISSRDNTMLPLRVCVSMFLVFFGITTQFAVCEDDTKYNREIIPGSDNTRLGILEKDTLFVLDQLEKLKNRFGKIGNIFGKTKKDEPKFKSSSFDEMMKKIKKYVGIAPGTNWCGDGDKAKDDDNLGRFKKTDACCREHDHCESNILSGETLLNLKNDGLFTRSACECDDKFYHCLKNASNLYANSIAKTYFNILQLQCFRCKYPTNDSTEDSAEHSIECKEYEWRDNGKA